MHEGLVIPVLVARTELQMRVQEQPQVVLPRREHDALVRRVLRQDHVVGIERGLAEGERAIGHRPAGAEREHHGNRQRLEGAAWAQHVLEQHRGPQRDGRVDEPEEQRGADQAQVRDQDQREEQRRAERAEVVEGQDVRDDVLEVEAIAQDAHQQRDLEPDQDADDEHHAVEHDAKAVGEAEGQKEDRRREAADQPHHQLDQDEAAWPRRARRSATGPSRCPSRTDTCR